jgi:NRPS condensation-like uncharacterized protein
VRLEEIRDGAAPAVVPTLARAGGGPAGPGNAQERGTGRQRHRRPGTDELTDFSAIDEAIHLVDSDVEPWSVHLEARLAAVLDEDRLRAAVAAAAARHPRASARRTERTRWLRRWAWEICPAPDPDALVEVADCPDDEALAAVRSQLQSRSIPLTGPSPLRLCLAHHPRGDVVMLNLNHAAADGIAALRLLNSIARAYVGHADPVVAPPGLAPLPRCRSAVRALAGELAELLAPAARVAPEDGHDAPGYGFHHVALPAGTTRALAGRAPGGATVNDLLLAALHLAIDEWNQDHRVPTERISVLMPVNLRPQQWWHEGVINASFMVPVSTRPLHRVDPATALAAVTRRTRQVKQGRTPLAVVGLLARLQPLPLSLKRLTARLLSRGRFVKTAILSNLGRLDEPPWFGSDAGDVVEMWFSPPAKMPLGLAIGALTLRGRLYLSFRFRHPLVAPAAAARFADRYAAALESLATESVRLAAASAVSQREPRRSHLAGSSDPKRRRPRRHAGPPRRRSAPEGPRHPGRVDRGCELWFHKPHSGLK